ncbi:hypothetical protein FBU30_009403 [Linnemannia zychae]|nr:hypothetical protein FBU30_009403 [Linnemannia zychae]
MTVPSSSSLAWPLPLAATADIVNEASGSVVDVVASDIKITLDSEPDLDLGLDSSDPGIESARAFDGIALVD